MRPKRSGGWRPLYAVRGLLVQNQSLHQSRPSECASRGRLARPNPLNFLRLGGFRFFRRHRMNLPAAILKHGFVRPPIRETLASRALNGTRRTFAITVAELDPVIIAEVVFREVSV